MDVFFAIIASYPVAIYTFLLIVVTIYWLITILGMIDIDVLDFTDIDGGSDLDSLGGLAGLLTKLGFTGVPMTVVLSLVALFGWWVAYFSIWLLPFSAVGIWHFILGTAILAISLIVAFLVTWVAIIPLRPLFIKNTARSKKSLLGQAVEIRSSWVDERFGQAEFKDAGVDLILNIRAKTPNQLKKGDRVVLLEYIKEDHAYLVIPERDFY